MTITFNCGNCGKQLITPDDKAGKRGKCPECGEPVTVPQLQTPVFEANPFDFESAASTFASSRSPAATRSCPMCGAEISATDAVCAHCGEELRPSGQTGEGRPPFSTGNKIEVGVILSEAWDRFSAQMGLTIAGLLIGYFSYMGISYLIMIPGMFVVAALMNVAPPLAILVAIIGYIVVLVAQVWIGLGMCMFSLSIARGEVPELTQIFTGGRFLARGTLCGLLVAVVFTVIFFGLGVIAGIVGSQVNEVAGGLIMVIAVILGLRVMMSVFWTGYVLVDTDAEGITALSLSRDLMPGNYLSVLVLLIVSQMVMFAGMVACMVGLILAVPFVMVMFAVAYDHLSGGGHRSKSFQA